MKRVIMDAKFPPLVLWRYMLILVSVTVMIGPIVPPRISETIASSEASIVGADFSTLLMLERNQQSFKDAGRVAPVERILSVHGVNYSRIRIWVSPQQGSGDLESALALARRSADEGMDILLNFHYSDTWAEPRSQQMPAAWENLSEQELIDTVRSYTQEVVSAFDDQGTPAAMVQVGNEVTKGMLWSWGKIDFIWGEYWDGFAALYKAGVEGARAATPDSPPMIVLHYYYDPKFSASKFFEKVEDYGMPFDIIGLTYYPFWSGSLHALGRSVNYLASSFDKDVLILETGYPWTVNDPHGCSVHADSKWDLPDRWVYPPTPEGQAAYLNGLRDVMKRVPDNHGLGFFVWEPAWLPSTTATDGACNKYANTTLFDWYGDALPALNRIAG